MENIYEKASDQHIRGTYIYLNASDGKAYAKKGGKEPINKETLMNMFNMGTAIVVDSEKGEYYRVVAMKVESDKATLTYLTNSDGVAAATVVSQEAE